MNNFKIIETNKKQKQKMSSNNNGLHNNDLVCDEDDEETTTYDRSLSKEAERVVKELGFGVMRAEVSSVLESTDSIAYMNIRTLEKDDWCVELNANGYLIVAQKFDTIDTQIKEANLTNKKLYETYEALMHQLSPMFVKKFNTSVAEKLQSIS